MQRNGLVIDLHTHSNFSDGAHAPGELVRRADAAGLSAIALTDHDTVRGLPDFLAAESACRKVPGIELSVDYAPGTLHLVGLFVDHASPALTELTEDLVRWRRERNEKLLAEVSELAGRAVAEEDLGNGRSGELGLPHIAAFLVEEGIARDTEDAFAGYLKEGGRLFVEKKRLNVERAVEAVHMAGGLAVMAHPWTLGLAPEQVMSFFARMKDIGLDGIEAYCSECASREEARLLNVAKRLNLGVSAGSDYHGESVTEARLGMVGANGSVGVAVLDELEERLARR